MDSASSTNQIFNQWETNRKTFFNGNSLNNTWAKACWNMERGWKLISIVPIDERRGKETAKERRETQHLLFYSISPSPFLDTWMGTTRWLFAHSFQSKLFESREERRGGERRGEEGRGDFLFLTIYPHLQLEKWLEMIDFTSYPGICECCKAAIRHRSMASLSNALSSEIIPFPSFPLAPGRERSCKDSIVFDKWIK